MRLHQSVALALALCLPAFAQEHKTHHAAKSVTLMTGLGNLHHPVSTKNVQAQQFFDQGLRLIYAFNHEEAERSFRQAAKLDPNLAMAYWGVAEAVGPNYNDPAGEERFRQAHDAIQKAVDLMGKASASDQAYIQAMARRFPADPQADLREAAENYRDAMGEVMKQFPDDLDAATLFAEAGMNLHPWGLWRPDGTPEEGTEQIEAALESVLRRDPSHLGANHYYIHTVEASSHPEKAMASAGRLASIAPGAGHIVHMPAHVYIRTGDYAAAVKTNQQAATVDRAYIAASGAQGLYPMMYYSHNLHFIATCAAMSGDYAEAQKAADLLAAHIRPHLQEMPSAEAFLTIAVAVRIRFHRWDDLLKLPQPDASMPAMTMFWHFARGLALANTGKVKQAEAEYKILAAAQEATPEDAIFAPPVMNRTKDIVHIAEDFLAAKIAMARHDPAGAITLLQSAVAIQDTLKYNEPPDWFFPVRESLGAAMLMNGDPAAAEAVFRADLQRNPRNPRSLWGLHQALKKQGKDYDAGFVEQQFRSSWKGAPLKAEDLV